MMRGPMSLAIAIGLLYGCGGGSRANLPDSGQPDAGPDAGPDGGPSLPVIASFGANPIAIAAGESSTLAWTTSGADAIRIEPGGYTSTLASGTRMVTPAADVTYTLTATNSSGSANAPATVAVGNASGYHVGPGRPYTSIGAVPWYQLKAGDTVYIHWKATPYQEKFLISGQGTSSQWIRVLGVPGPNGELPVISGDNATTGPNMHHHWQDASGGSAIQDRGIIQVAVNNTDVLPAYIEIAGLEIRDAGNGYRFTAENGTQASYSAFAACIYARSVRHLLVRDNVIHNCGNGIYNWIGTGGQPETFWDGIQLDTVLRGNHIYDNGAVGSYSIHQTYTESDRIVIEYNHYGPMKVGARGSQLKDRSAGTVVRYNFIEQSPEGWDLDLIDPDNSWSSDCSAGGNPNGLNCRPYYARDFVYGNVIVNRCSAAGCNPNFVHWNEDLQAGHGRALQSGGALTFYDNTIVLVADSTDFSGRISLFNHQWGAYDCPIGQLPGVIDFRNNLVVSLPRTSGGAVPLDLGYCGLENVNLGVNWISPGWTAYRSGAPGSSGSVTGATNVVSPVSNDPGFVNAQAGDFHLVAGSTAAGIGGPLAPAVTANALGLDLTPTLQYRANHSVEPRARSGAGSDVGAFQR